MGCDIHTHIEYKQNLYVGIVNGDQPNIYYHHSYREFCIKDDKRRGGEGKSSTYRYMKDFENDCKQISKDYYDMKFNHTIT